MGKPEIEFKKEPLKYICNEAFYGVKGILNIESDKSNKTLAFIFGAIAGYLVAEVGAQSHKIVDQNQILTNNGITLEELAKDGLIGTWSIIFGSRFIAPKYFTQFTKDNPIYSSGTFGVMLGASARALQELIF